MEHWLTEPFESNMVLRALVAGIIAACLCSLVGCWVVLRRNVFLGEAMTHGMLPGVALAALLGASLMVGGLVAALVMAVGVAAISRSSKVPSDTSIGLLLVGMLALGVIIVSRSQSFAVDLTGFLFGDVFAVGGTDLAVLGTALVVTTLATLLGHRAFVAVTFDPRKAETLGLRPRLAIPALTLLMAGAMVASFHIVGTLLVLGLLIAPTAAAMVWAKSIPRIMLLSAVLGSVSVYVGLLISWYAGLAGGATVAGVAVLVFFASTLLSRSGFRWTRMSALAVTALMAVGCAATEGPDPQRDTPSAGAHEDVGVEGAREIEGAITKLVLVDPATGGTSVYDAVDEVETGIGSYGPTRVLVGDGRFGYLRSGESTTVIDAGAWTFDHGDHYHYFASEPAMVATLDIPVASVSASNTVAAVHGDSGAIELLDREKLGQKIVEPAAALTLGADVASAVPYGSRVVTVTAKGRMQVVGKDGATDLAGECRAPSWASATRRAVVFGCGTGAVRVTGGEKELTVTAIPFPADAPAQRPTQMEHRDRADVFAGLSQDTVWVLDSRQRSWTTVPVDDAVATTTAGDGSVLVLRRDGTMSSFDVNTRNETVRVPLFSAPIPTDGPQPVIEIDSDRAYVNDAAAKVVYEIDYGDGLRVARTLTTELTPTLMVEAGR